MHQKAAVLLIAVGLLAVAVGGLLYLGALSWLGRLPGDLRIGGEHSRIYIPIISMLLLSLVLTVIVNVLRWLLE